MNAKEIRHKCIPSIIYKYKGLRTKEDLVRTLDIINNNRLFFPTYTQLNDPFEGSIVNITLDGYAGCSMSLCADEEDVVVKGEKEKYHILVLSQRYDAPLLWAHYANNYDGVCFCFATNNDFKSLKKVEYCPAREDIFVYEEDDIRGYVESSFYKKNQSWNYEDEWRIISKKNDNYFTFNRKSFVGIIIGHKVVPEVADCIIKSLRKDVLIMKTYVGHRTFGIHVQPYDYDYEHDGSARKALDVECSLLKKKFIFAQ